MTPLPQKSIRSVIFLICVCIVLWQCYMCVNKYLDKPQGTHLSVVNSAGKMFPSITVCPDAFNSSSVLNASSLSECGINSDKYRWEYIWSVKDSINSECRDPKRLFEKITFKPEDLLFSIDISLFDQSQYSKITIWPNDTGNF